MRWSEHSQRVLTSKGRRELRSREVVPMELSAAMFDQIVSHGLGGWLQEWPEMTAPDHPSRGSFTARPPGSAGFLYQNLYDSYVADGAAVATRDAGGRTVHTLSGVCEQEYALSRHGDLI